MNPSCVSDPILAAWQASHPTDHLPPGDDCARCGSAAGTVKIWEAVSKKFTGWDTWADASRPRVCIACAWGYRTKSLRADVLAVTRSPAGPACTRMDPGALADMLLQGPLPSDVTISLPLRAGRRHVLPSAQFGQVCLDGTNLPWSHGDGQRLQLVDQLRREGVPWRAFTEPAPPWRALSRSADPAGLLERWDQLAHWRASGLWLQVALAATHPQQQRQAA